MILIIDNYDSFTYNLYQLIGSFYEDIRVVRNDSITIPEIKALKPIGIIISPGPGSTKDSGISRELVANLHGDIPILGICLGHLVIGEFFGLEVTKNTVPIHGKKTDINIERDNEIFCNLPPRITVGRYHSLILNRDSFKGDTSPIEIIGVSDSDEIMAIKIKDSNTFGLQFHPESILTKDGEKIILNFLINILKLDIPIDQEKVICYKKPKEIEALKKYITKVSSFKNLTEEESSDAMEIISSGISTNSQISSFITALKMKGETSVEITGFVKKMMSKCNNIKGYENSLDIVGTGGDNLNTFNISTTSAIVLAALGVNILKHGNKSISSKCGSSDLLRELGVYIESSRDETIEIFKKTNLAFLFAPTYHPAMSFVGTPRSEIGIRTLFNILGPLMNPSGAKNLLLGVYEERLMKIYSDVLMNLHIENALIVHGNDGQDEISTTAPTKYIQIKNGVLIEENGIIHPEKYGIKLSHINDIKGVNPMINKDITLGILNGEKGPKRDAVILNCAFALRMMGRSASVDQGILEVSGAIDNGLALKKLQSLIKHSNCYRKEM